MAESCPSPAPRRIITRSKSQDQRPMKRVRSVDRQTSAAKRNKKTTTTQPEDNTELESIMENAGNLDDIEDGDLAPPSSSSISATSSTYVDNRRFDKGSWVIFKNPLSAVKQHLGFIRKIPTPDEPQYRVSVINGSKVDLDYYLLPIRMLLETLVEYEARGKHNVTISYMKLMSPETELHISKQIIQIHEDRITILDKTSNGSLHRDFQGFEKF